MGSVNVVWVIEVQLQYGQWVIASDLDGSLMLYSTEADAREAFEDVRDRSVVRCRAFADTGVEL
jgi:hypothetical protein